MPKREQNEYSGEIFVVRGRGGYGEPWADLAFCPDRRAAESRMLDLRGGPYRDLSIVRRPVASE